MNETATLPGRCHRCGALIVMVGRVHLCRPANKAAILGKQPKAVDMSTKTDVDTKSVDMDVDKSATIPVATKAKPRDAAYWRERKRQQRARPPAQTVNKP